MKNNLEKFEDLIKESLDKKQKNRISKFIMEVSDNILEGTGPYLGQRGETPGHKKEASRGLDEPNMYDRLGKKIDKSIKLNDTEKYENQWNCDGDNDEDDVEQYQNLKKKVHYRKIDEANYKIHTLNKEKTKKHGDEMEDWAEELSGEYHPNIFKTYGKRYKSLFGHGELEKHQVKDIKDKTENKFGPSAKSAHEVLGKKDFGAFPEKEKTIIDLDDTFNSELDKTRSKIDDIIDGIYHGKIKKGIFSKIFGKRNKK